ncbi:MAG TPA: carboxypeptidase-like regulatory domain-containing protein [Allosphingosinicella sp.]
MLGIIAALLAASAVPAVGGVYVANQPETATGLMLAPDGRYEWAFSQGALDLESEGRWVREGDRIILTSRAYRPPRFSLSKASRSGVPGISVTVETAPGKPVQGIDVLLRYAGGKSDTGDTGAEGEYRFEPAPGDKPLSVALAIGMFQVESEAFPLDASRVDTLSFTIDPGDLGKQSFAAEPAAIVQDGLELTWRGQKLLYRRTAQ